jgi:hypothetical protein
MIFAAMGLSLVVVGGTVGVDPDVVDVVRCVVLADEIVGVDPCVVRGDGPCARAAYAGTFSRKITKTRLDVRDTFCI